MTNTGPAPEVAWERLDSLYRETILDHARNPRNRSPLREPDVRAHVLNPFCGDEVFVDMAWRDGRVADVCVRSNGCAICQASTSMMSELLRDRDVATLRKLSRRFSRMMRNEEPSERGRAELGPAQALVGVALFPTRIKCALLPWSALDEALDDYEARLSARSPGRDSALRGDPAEGSAKERSP